MTVDEILESGRYVDGRGGKWVRCSGAAEWLGWFCVSGGRPFLTTAQMRLLIERDQHRDKCPGLQNCKEHPVPYVWIGVTGSPHHDPAWGFNDGNGHDTLPEAMDAARALAVGE